jgi:hypothetical protein
MESTPLYPNKRSLVEECHSIDIRDLQKMYGRDRLFRAADNGSPIHIQIGNHSYQAIFTWTAHRLPGWEERWSSIQERNCRIWHVCQSCYQKFRILYVNPSFPSRLACRKCLGLIYQSEYCGKNLWWRKARMPLKKLFKRQDKLFKMKRTHRVRDELEIIEGQILMLMQRAKPKGKTQRQPGIKRRYRDMNLAIGPYRAFN